MTQVQKRYAEKRINLIRDIKIQNVIVKFDRRKAAKKAIAKLGLKIVPQSALKALMMAEIIDMGNYGYSSVHVNQICLNAEALRNEVDLQQMKLQEDVQVKQDLIKARAQAICDELVLGEASDILKKIEEFEKEV